MTKPDKITMVKSVLKNQGIFSVLRRSFFYTFNPLMVPVTAFRLKRAKKRLSTQELINYTYSVAGNTMAPMQVKSEIYKLLKYLKEDCSAKVILEIGTARGGTLYLLSKVSPEKATLISMDLRDGDYGGGYALWREKLFPSFASSGQTLHLLQGNSHDPLMKDKLRDLLAGRKVDFLLIDGDHSYEGVRKDFELYQDLLAPGGSVAFHDIAPHGKDMNCDVDRYWMEIKDIYPSMEFVEDTKQGWAGIGIMKCL